MANDILSYDLTRKRPIELRLRDMRDEEGGGISEKEANRLDRVSCDGFLLVRLMQEAEDTRLLTASVDGQTFGPLSTEALFRMWVSLAGHIARTANTDDAKERRWARFCTMILQHLQLGELVEAAGIKPKEPEPAKEPELCDPNVPLGLESLRNDVAAIELRIERERKRLAKEPLDAAECALAHDVAYVSRMKQAIAGIEARRQTEPESPARLAAEALVAQMLAPGLRDLCPPQLVTAEEATEEADVIKL